MTANSFTAETIALPGPQAKTPGKSRRAVLVGRILSAAPFLMLFSGGINALLKVSFVVEGLRHYGYPASALLVIGLAELVCSVLYVIPKTSLLGALLMTAYLGGAVATHVRAGEPFFLPVVFAIVAWAGLALRDARVRNLLLNRSE